MYLEGINHFLLSTSVAELLRLNHAKIKKEEIPYCIVFSHMINEVMITSRYYKDYT